MIRSLPSESIVPKMRFSNGAVLTAQRGSGTADVPPTVLVVEDDDVDFAVLRDLLRPTGCSLERAADLRAAQHRVGEHEHPIDLVVADLNLGDGWPGTTFDALALAWDHKPIIVVSGCSPELGRVGQGLYPIVEVFDKNAFDAAAFVAVVRATLHASRSDCNVGREA